MSRFISLLNLAYRFNLHMLKKPFLADTKGKDLFIANYRDDHLFPMGPELRSMFPELQGCLACGACDAVCNPVSDARRHLFAGPSSLACSITRNLPDYHLLGGYLQQWGSCEGCTDCLHVCPADVPLKELAAFAGAVFTVIQHLREGEDPEAD